MSAKSRPGACDVCGCPVVREAETVIADRMASEPRAWINGHLYVQTNHGVRLEKVRCDRHARELRDPTDPRATWGAEGW